MQEPQQGCANTVDGSLSILAVSLFRHRSVKTTLHTCITPGGNNHAARLGKWVTTVLAGGKDGRGEGAAGTPCRRSCRRTSSAD